MSKNQFDLSIVIPAYHEEKRIGKTLDLLAKYLQEKSFFRNKKIEVIVVSANSDDKTHDIIKDRSVNFKTFVFLKPGSKVGKGRDVQYGMLKARGNIVMFMDADMATPLKYIEKFYVLCEKEADIIIATRNLLKHHEGFMRRAISKTGNLLFRIAGGVWVEDSQCGFKFFTNDASSVCFSKLTILGWGFDMEVLAIAKANHLSIKSIRVNDWISVPEGTFTDGFVKNTLIAFKDLMHIAKRRISNQYVK